MAPSAERFLDANAASTPDTSDPPRDTTELPEGRPLWRLLPLDDAGGSGGGSDTSADSSGARRQSAMSWDAVSDAGSLRPDSRLAQAC